MNEHTVSIALGAWLLGVNLLTFFTYGVDKYRASRKGQRIPENTLHLLSLLGGTPGAWMAQRIFRHKTLKTSFRVVFYAIALLQMTSLWAWIWFASSPAPTAPSGQP